MGSAVLSFVVVTHPSPVIQVLGNMHISSPLLSETVHPVGPPDRVDGHVLEHGEECCLQSWLRHCLLISELIYKCLMDHSVLWGRPVPGKKPEREPLCSSFHKTSAPGQGRIGPVYGDHLDKDVSFAYSFVSLLLLTCWFSRCLLSL